MFAPLQGAHDLRLLTDALSRLSAARAVTVDSRLATALNPDLELAGFDRRMEVIRQKPTRTDVEKPPTIDVQELVERWQRTPGDITKFTKREIRAMCWSSEIAGDKSFITIVKANPAFAANARILRGLWFSHERKWRLSTSTDIESLINGYKLSKGSHPRWLRNIWLAKGLLGEDAPSALATAAETDWRECQRNLERVAVTLDGQLGTQAIAAMINRWKLALTQLRLPDLSVALFDAGHEGLLANKKLPTEVFRDVVEQCVGAVAKIGEPYRQRIAEWIISDERMGHPARRQTRGNWSGISERTRQLAVQLFAARDLGAFFQVLIGSGDDSQKRRRFWERYVESPQLMNFSIASDVYDRRKLIANLGKDRVYAAQLLDAPPEHSAFLMQFRTREYDIVIAEMSKANNSMFMYNTAAFEEHVGNLQDSHFTFRELKSKTVSFDQKRHVGDWHERFAQVLSHYGIYPGRF